MAEIMLDPSKFNENVNEEILLRDSLESSIEGFNDSISTIRTNETGLNQDSDKLGLNISSPNDLAKVPRTMDKEQEPKVVAKKAVMKPKQKNMIELNKMNVKKGQVANSYSKMHQKKVGKTTPRQNSQNGDSEKTNAPSNAVIALHKKLVLDGILTEKDELNNFSTSNNHTLEQKSEWNSLNPLIWEEYNMESTRYTQSNIMTNTLGESFTHYTRSGCTNENLNACGYIGFSEHGIEELPPVHQVSTSSQSAPANMQEYLDLPHEKSLRSNSVNALKVPRVSHVDLNSSMTSQSSLGSTTYSSIYANSKQDLKTNYKPYTLSDYKRLKKGGKAGGLGPDTKSEAHQQKVKSMWYSQYMKQGGGREGIKSQVFRGTVVYF